MISNDISNKKHIKELSGAIVFKLANMNHVSSDEIYLGRFSYLNLLDSSTV